MLEEPGCLIQLRAQPHEPFWLLNLVVAQSGLPHLPPLLSCLEASTQIGDFRLERRRKKGCLPNFTWSHRLRAPAPVLAQLGSMRTTGARMPNTYPTLLHRGQSRTTEPAGHADARSAATESITAAGLDRGS
jgi:hypothetical protein